MKRLALAIVLGVAVAIPAAIALADTENTNSWGCAWQGSTYTSGGTIYGYTAEDLPYDCSSRVVIIFTYKLNGTCYYGDWEEAYDWVIQRSHSGSGGVSSHQIYVPGEGYGQWINTSDPWELC